MKDFVGMDIDSVVTVCDHAQQTCPFFPGENKIVHQGFEDPAAFSGGEREKLAVFRRVRDEIWGWVKELCGRESVD